MGVNNLLITLINHYLLGYVVYCGVMPRTPLHIDTVVDIMLIISTVVVLGLIRLAG